MKQKKETKKKQKEVFLTPVEPTQFNVPIRDVYDGVIITDDHKYIKTLEVEAQPFFFKKIGEQNRISNAFSLLFKQAPDYLHFKSMSVPADLSYQIKRVEDGLKNEGNRDCAEMGAEYIQRLREAQDNSVTRRFFISFPCTNTGTAMNPKGLPEIVRQLNFDASRIERALNDCGNQVIYPEDGDLNAAALKMLYMVYNRDSYLKTTFEDYVDIVNQRYADKIMEKNDGEQYFYVPPKDYIAPQKVSYLNRKYLVVNGTYYSFLYIPSNGYNKVVETGWLNKYITSFAGVDVDIFFKRLPREKVITGIRRAIGYSRYSASEQADTSDSFEDAVNRLNSAEYLRSGLSDGFNDYYQMATIITVSGTSPDEVENHLQILKKEADADGMIFRENIFRCEETFNLVLPTTTWDDDSYTLKKASRNVLTEGAASVFPFATNHLIDKDGLYIADSFNGSPIIINQHNRARVPAGHIWVSGITGAGKSTLLMTLALRSRCAGRATNAKEGENGMPTYIIAPEKDSEYKRLTRAIGGQFIDLSNSSNDRINPLAIYQIDEEIQNRINYIDDETGSSSYLQRKVATLSNFFSMHIGQIDSDERFDLEDAIMDTYARFGITEDNESLWADKEHTHYKEMPIISDLVKTLERKGSSPRLAKTIRLLTRGNGAMFNGQTNIAVNNRFCVFGLEHVSEDMLPLATFLALDFIESKITEDRTSNKYLLIDECWKIIMEKSGYGCKKLLSMSRLLRAYGCAMVLATQNLSSVLSFDGGRSAKEVINNCPTKILLKLSENEAFSVQEVLDLTDEERENIRKFNTGDALLIAGETHMNIHVTPSEKEKLYIFTDKESIERFEKEKREREEAERLARLFDNADDMNGRIVYMDIPEEFFDA